MKQIAEEQEDWIQDLREAWPSEEPPLTLQPDLQDGRGRASLLRVVPVLAAAALVAVLLSAPLWFSKNSPQAPARVELSPELLSWPDEWRGSGFPQRKGFSWKAQDAAELSQGSRDWLKEDSTQFRTRLQRAEKRLNDTKKQG